MSVNKADLLPYLEKYGRHCMAYTSLEPSMEYFLVDGIGYISYIRYRHWFWARKERKIVLADPICAAENVKRLVELFLIEHSNVIFVQVSREIASVLDSLGLQVNQFGIETDLHLDNFELKGKHRAKLRQWKNKCKREGVTIVERPISDCENIRDIKALSADWLKTKGGNELSFLVRPIRYQNEKDVRYFWAFQDSKLIAIATFDPMYSNDKVVAYYHNIDRFDAGAPHGTSASIVLKAMQQFSEEGVKYVTLGMSPLFLQRGLDNEFNFNQFTRRAFWYAFEKLNFIYPFKGNASHKKKFNGSQSPVYIAATRGVSLKEVLIVVKANGNF